MGKVVRTLFFSLLFIGIILGIIIANIGWPAFVAIVQAQLLNLAQALHLPLPG